ncbi:hypothetical protein [Vibrio cholerae]|uniref:hypothetical protein n=1 Tax=Vibrio cholerae TaxID=666 RepID=UPI001E46F021|nr:hypothetical protein [Vibrio cholerae]MCD1226816.1 hypothetical protein [Vibrio cholerae]
MADNNATYRELKSSYDQIKGYLDRSMLGPEDESLLRSFEELGDKLHEYHTAIIESNSSKLKASQKELEELISNANEAKEVLKEAEGHVKNLAKLANAVDKILKKLGKFF